MIALEMLFHMRLSTNRLMHVVHPTAIHRRPFYLFVTNNHRIIVAIDLGAITRFNNKIKAITSKANTAIPPKNLHLHLHLHRLISNLNVEGSADEIRLATACTAV